MLIGPLQFVILQVTNATVVQIVRCDVRKGSGWLASIGWLSWKHQQRPELMSTLPSPPLPGSCERGPVRISSSRIASVSRSTCEIRPRRPRLARHAARERTRVMLRRSTPVVSPIASSSPISLHVLPNSLSFSK